MLSQNCVRKKLFSPTGHLYKSLPLAKEKHKQRRGKNLRGLSPQVGYTNQPTSGGLLATLITLAERGCHMVGTTDSHGCILDFLDQSCYYFFQVAPQLYSRG
jgi:hypothetical protein